MQKKSHIPHKEGVSTTMTWSSLSIYFFVAHTPQRRGFYNLVSYDTRRNYQVAHTPQRRGFYNQHSTHKLRRKRSHIPHKEGVSTTLGYIQSHIYDL